ncbi:hypothetical protein OD350_29405 (plasmid) [Clostridium beijerinckii]|uniref:hypothetical protein n=1 Tax=Clostridium beijerinckii TaxID=1520 RepID=UPI002227FF8C|nr:hypothetical protein [Clostridium beijerinckii]UYZ39007.1 hypothetical protein OD350_29405 [Clostridium beijerinckii]
MENKRKVDINKVEKKIQNLIDTGKIKSAEDIKDIPIDEIHEKTNICVTELLCYFCQKGDYEIHCCESCGL